MALSPAPQGVSMLKAFGAPEAFGGENLTYPNLEAVAGDARQKETDLLNEFWGAAPGSLEEEKLARSAAIGYFVLTANRLHQVAPARQPLVSGRFTQSSVELYGKPKPDALTQLLTNQYSTFSRYIDNPRVDQTRLNSVLGVLKNSLGTSSERAESRDDDLQSLGTQMKDILYSRYGNALRLFDAVEQSGVQPDLETIRDLFEQGINELAKTNETWHQWVAAITNGEGMSTLSNKIAIGRKGNYKPERLKAHFAHEVLVHALRSINGYATGDVLLGQGLPGNLDTEEGIGIFMEFAMTGIIPAKVSDRYIDVGLALGQTKLPALTRKQLHDFHANRQILRAQAAGRTPDIAAVERFAWNHTDRIYRGSLGNEVIGVNTKDIAYYQGFIKITNYFRSEMASGKSLASILEYVMSGRFDPTDARHTDYVAAARQR